MDHIIRKRPEFVEHWMLPPDNARPHAASTVIQFLASKGVQCNPHNCHSPDLVSCDLLLFSTLTIKGSFENSASTIGAAVKHAEEI
jgi:hypothetical protein